MSELLVTKAEARQLSFYYGDFRALKSISMPVHERVTALIEPSGCGKSTFLRCFNRMHDLYPGNRYEGEIVLQPDNTNLLARDVDPIEVRMRIGMVFQSPTPFPSRCSRTSPTGCACAVRLAPAHRGEGRAGSEDAALWDGVKDRLHQPAYNCPAAASSACAHRPRARHDPGCCCSTSRPRRSTRSLRPRSRS